MSEISNLIQRQYLVSKNSNMEIVDCRSSKTRFHFCFAVSIFFSLKFNTLTMLDCFSLLLEALAMTINIDCIIKG